jgi:hypothetical protein
MPVTTTNYIYRMGTAPNVRSAISQKNKVYGYAVGAKGFVQVGVISEFSTDESRTIDAARGVGFGDQIAELVPSITEPMTMTLNRTLLNTANVFQTVGYKAGIDGIARSLKHHRWPFDIKQELVFSEISTQQDVGAGPNAQPATLPYGTQPSQQFIFNPAATPILAVEALFTYFEGCWFNSYSASFTSDAAMVAENASVTVSDIIDGVSQYGEFIDTGLAPISDNGQAGAGFSLRFASNSAAATTVPPGA